MVIKESSYMMTTSGVAKMLHIHINTVRRWSDQGILKPYRIGPRGDRRFVRDDITEFLTAPQSSLGNPGNGKNLEAEQVRKCL